MLVSWGGGQPPNIKRGSWILDTSTDTDAKGNFVGVHGLFYRVASVSQPSSNAMNLELQTPLVKALNSITVLDSVVEVFSRGAVDHSNHWEFRNEQ